jgi:5-methylcytosine-specific restriction endonuclease McrA
LIRFSEEQRNDIYDRTSGYCHICRKKLAFNNYGRFGAKGAWEVEHSKPQSRGGTNRLNNLYAACVSCNRSKNNSSTRTARGAYGNRKAPLSTEARKRAKAGNAVAGGVLGAIAGLVFGPGGAIIGGAIGAKLGHKKNPDKNRS